MASACLLSAVILSGCWSTLPDKKYYLLNYIPVPPQTRLSVAPYPFTLRFKEFAIDEAYASPQIVYRQSPYQLQFYFYQIWAVKPMQMINDLIFKHLASVNLARGLARRYDGGQKPDFELSGTIEALDEYDSDKVWFAHMAILFRLRRTSDDRVVYNRRFDNRKRVFKNDPQNVVKEMSAIMEFIMSQVIQDLDVALDREAGQPGNQMPPIMGPVNSMIEVPADSGQ